ncbi:MAG: DUF6249 domain-containing protein [Chryseolinea sp.]
MNGEFLMPLSILGSFGLSLYWFTRAITDYQLKKRMIEKGFVNDDTQAIFKAHHTPGRYGSLKWGLLTLFGGVALILMEYLDVNVNSPLPYGLVAVSLSIGFLVYYFIIKKEVK